METSLFGEQHLPKDSIPPALQDIHTDDDLSMAQSPLRICLPKDIQLEVSFIVSIASVSYLFHPGTTLAEIC